MFSRLKIWTLMLTGSALLSGGLQANQYYMNDMGVDEFYVSDNCCKQFNANIDFLWWQLRQTEGFGSSGVSNSLVSDGLSSDSSFLTDEITTISTSKTHHPHLNYDPGVRLGLHYNDECSCLDIGLIWTHFYTNAHSHLSAGPGETIFVGGGLEALSNHFRVQLDYVDLDFSRKICLLPCFSITPHVGLRGLWLEMHSKSHGTAGIPFGTTNQNFHFREKLNDWGIGIEGGLWMQWSMECGLSLLGHVGGSVLWYNERFTNSTQTSTTAAGGALLSNAISKFKTTTRTGTPTFEYFLGVQYEFDLCGYDLQFIAGWEQFFIDFEFYNFQGLTTGLGVNF